MLVPEVLRARDVSPEPSEAAPHSPSFCFYEQLIDGLHDGVYFVNPDRVITYWNRGAAEISGYSSSEAVGRSCFDNFLNHVDDQGCRLCLDGCPLEATLKDGQRREAEVYLRHKQGHRVPILVRVAPIKDAAGEIVGAVELFTDASARNHDERRAGELERLAFEDSLTELPNRRYTDLQLKQALQEVREFARSVGILLIDLDHFKAVNDVYGHKVGDEALRTVSKTLGSSFRAGDVVGRWGGEEFLAVIRDVSADELGSLAERCRKLLAESFVEAGGRRIRITASLGATLAYADDTETSVVARADELMYKSKLRGRNRVSLERPAT